jgi:hypothetical protein
MTAHPYLDPRLRKEYSYASIHCLGLHGLFQVEIYLYSILKLSITLFSACNGQTLVH